MTCSGGLILILDLQFHLTRPNNFVNSLLFVVKLRKERAGLAREKAGKGRVHIPFSSVGELLVNLFSIFKNFKLQIGLRTRGRRKRELSGRGARMSLALSWLRSPSIMFFVFAWTWRVIDRTGDSVMAYDAPVACESDKPKLYLLTPRVSYVD